MRRIVCGLAVVVVLVVVGCGGTGESAGSGQSAAAGDTWTKAATLSSSDAPGASGVPTCQSFTTSGRVRLVLDVPGDGALGVVVGSIVPADQAGDGSSLLKALKNAESVTLNKAKNAVVVTGLSGAYVLVLTPPAVKEWSVEIQTAP
ncbi:MAG: hypothetical protein NTX16_12825 [Actinobacteria bacterium]|nr:hypothetical protein [Actinomycetota bacterium]